MKIQLLLLSLLLSGCSGVMNPFADCGWHVFQNYTIDQEPGNCVIFEHGTDARVTYVGQSACESIEQDIMFKNGEVALVWEKDSVLSSKPVVTPIYVVCDENP